MMVKFMSMITSLCRSIDPAKNCNSNVRTAAGLPKLYSLQGIRAIAFLCVFVFHAVRTFPGKGRTYKVLSLALGPWGVSVFFILSGFVMTYSYWNRPPAVSLRDSMVFAAKKIKRLYPLHLCMLAVGAVRLYLQKKGRKMILRRLLITVPLLQTWFPVGYKAVNSVAWYLSVSLFLYFVFPFAYSFMKNENEGKAFLKIAGVFAAQMTGACLLYKYTAADIKWVTYCHPLFRLGDFVAGGLLASILMNHREAVNRDSANNQGSGAASGFAAAFTASLAEAAAAALCVFCCIYYTMVPKDLVWMKYSCLFMPANLFLIYVFALSRGIFSNLLSGKVMLWLADFSVYAFLIHRLVIYGFFDFVTRILHLDQINYPVIVLVPFVLTTAAVYLYSYLEKRIKASLALSLPAFRKVFSRVTLEH